MEGKQPRGEVRVQDCRAIRFEASMKVVESRLAGSVLASIYLTMMRADESLHHLMGNLCQARGCEKFSMSS